jgi:enamine deaminase RidA (YjgF/YER057c/UK114 family)
VHRIPVLGLDATEDGDGHMRAGPPVDLPEGPHGDETSGVSHHLVSSGAAFEDRVGYSRAVRVDGQVWVSGTAPILAGGASPPDDAYEQAKICIGIIARALGEAGAKLDDVVRTRIYLTRAEDIDEVGRAHREAFGRIRPATTAVVVGLLDSRWRVEIEAEAVVPWEAQADPA